MFPSMHIQLVTRALLHLPVWHCSRVLASSRMSSSSEPNTSIRTVNIQPSDQCEEQTSLSALGIIVANVRAGRTDDDIFEDLMHEQASGRIHLSNNLILKLLCQFKDDWRSAVGIFRWASSTSGFKHSPEAYDIMVDILGKMRQFDKMKILLEEMSQGHVIKLSTVAKAMRRFAGAGKWEDAVRIFDELGRFGLVKNVESMNLLLDTLCKENKVEQARSVFLELKSHIPPTAHTFNIFIHGWCKVNRVDEAHWTIQEMKGYGYQPSVISYSTIIQFYCQRFNFGKVYELLGEMQAQGCPPNVITHTTVMCSLTKSEDFEAALQIAERVKSAGCKPDTLFYNALIRTLDKAGRLGDAMKIFVVEMPKNGIPWNTSTYNSIISMLCRHDQLQKAFGVLDEMEKSSLCRPDVQTYYPLLKSCFKTEKQDTLRNLLNDMVNKHHLSLDLSAYKLLIHGLCKVNRCDCAYILFLEMIGQGLMPTYNTCRVLLDLVRLKGMCEAVGRIETFMKKLRLSK